MIINFLHFSQEYNHLIGYAIFGIKDLKRKGQKLISVLCVQPFSNWHTLWIADVLNGWIFIKILERTFNKNATP